MLHPALMYLWLAYWSNAWMRRSGYEMCLEMAACPVEVAPERSAYKDVGAP